MRRDESPAGAGDQRALVATGAQLRRDESRLYKGRRLLEMTPLGGEVPRAATASRGTERAQAPQTGME